MKELHMLWNEGIRGSNWTFCDNCFTQSQSGSRGEVVFFRKKNVTKVLRQGRNS